jgi:hypothetical protein
MRRTELLQEIRKMRFEKVCLGWSESRLIQCVMPEYIYSRNIRGPDQKRTSFISNLKGADLTKYPDALLQDEENEGCRLKR